jgi:hypothetical protein
VISEQAAEDAGAAAARIAAVAARRAAGLVVAFTDIAGHRLVGGAGLAHAANAILVAGFHDVLAARDANLLHAAFLHAAGNLAADFPVASLAHAAADVVADFLAVRIADGLLHLAAMHVAVLLIDRPAHRVAAFLLAMLAHAPRHAALDLLEAVLDARLVDHASDFLPARPLHGPRADFLDVLVLGDLALPHLGAALVAITGYFLVDGFTDRLVAGVPAFFQHLVIDELVGDSILLLAG